MTGGPAAARRWPLDRASTPPAEWQMHVGPDPLQAPVPPRSRPVTGVLDLTGPVEPGYAWRRMDECVAVLLKGAQVPGFTEPATWDMVASAGQGPDSWECALPVPIDLTWLGAHVQLPEEDVSVAETTRSGLPLPSIGELFYTVTSRELASDPRWIDAGWRTGEPFDGPVPPPVTSLEWDNTLRRLNKEARKAAGKKWWQA